MNIEGKKEIIRSVMRKLESAVKELQEVGIETHTYAATEECKKALKLLEE